MYIYAVLAYIYAILTFWNDKFAVIEAMDYSGLFFEHITPFICYEMLILSYFDKFLLILFVGFKISFYFCISKNDKTLK